MKILLSNYHLVDRAGSELYTLELSSALRDAGHRVGVFTFRPGPISDLIRAQDIPVFSLRDGAELEAFAPEVVHSHHAPCLHFLAAHALSCPVVHGMLGPDVSFERPPSVFDGVALGLAVSEEVRDAAAGTPFAGGVELRVMRNWFDDRPLTRRPATRPDDVRRVVVITNHLDPALARQLEALAERRPAFQWSHWGAPNRVREVTAEALEPFDAVISIGRSALLAGALGKPCLLYDVHGCDGWLDAPRLPQLASRNFSGRLTGARPPLDPLLFEPPDPEPVAEACWADHRLTARVDELAAHYADALVKGIRLSPQARIAHGALGGLLADIQHAADQRWATKVERLERDARSRETALKEVEGERDALLVRQRELTEREQLLSRDLTVLRESLGVQLVERVKRLPGLYPAYLRSKRWWLYN